jgi:uncharacterized membrane protein
MAFSFNDPIIQLGLFICAYIIVTGVCTYFGYSSDQYGIYMAFTAFILSVVMILPDPIQIGNNLPDLIQIGNNLNNVATNNNSPPPFSVNSINNDDL